MLVIAFQKLPIWPFSNLVPMPTKKSIKKYCEIQAQNYLVKITETSQSWLKETLTLHLLLGDTWHNGHKSPSPVKVSIDSLTNDQSCEFSGNGSLYSTLSHSLSVPHFFLFFLVHFLFSKVATAGQRTAEAALGPISEAPHRPQQTTDIQNTVAERQRERGEGRAWQKSCRCPELPAKNR